MPSDAQVLDSETDTGESELGEERIRERAYEISQTEESGTPEENWTRAEQELSSSAD